MWEAIFWLFVGVNVGVVGMGWISGGKCQELQNQIDLKRELWCGPCRFKLDSKGFDDQLATERKSKYDALRYKEKEIQALRVKLYEATRQQGIAFMDRNVARG